VRNWRRFVLAGAVPIVLVIAFPIGRASAGGPAPASATSASPAATSPVSTPALGVGPQAAQAATAQQAAHPGVPLTRCLPITTRCSPAPPLSTTPTDVGVALVGVLVSAVGVLGLLLLTRGRRMWRTALAAGAFDRVLRPPRALLPAA
jgi:hypothetical protein